MWEDQSSRRSDQALALREAVMEVAAGVSSRAQPEFPVGLPQSGAVAIRADQWRRSPRPRQA